MPNAARIALASPVLALSLLVGRWCAAAEEETQAAGVAPLDYEIKLETVLKHDDGRFLWYHPRTAAIPGLGSNGGPRVVMTLQKHLSASDHYSGLSLLTTDDLGANWSGPEARPELDWVAESEAVDVAVADVTPGWHGPTGKYLAIGAQVRYSKRGEQLEDRPRSNQTAYAVHDPRTGEWTAWRQLEMPDEPKFNFARNACSQWLVEADGTLLVPLYYGPSGSEPNLVTVARCRFDGSELAYLTHGTEMALNVERGLCEPSLALYRGKYFLTIRNDQKGYVTASDDGLVYAPIKEWTFDDGSELGSYNTQQHWLVHGDGLFLVYTRRGADNDHIFRHRAPLFMAQVDPERLCVVRATERIVIPERGATLGNFGASAITANESWITVSEGVWNDDARRRGAEGALFVARILWSKPNRLVDAP
jgi:hypothetical protein